MYLKLGTIKATRYYDNPNDFIILSEVPSSSMSFESPTRVRSLDELNIWFGKTYPEYQYLRELVESGITLYLYKPIKPDIITNTYDDKYLDDQFPYPSIEYIQKYIPGEEETRYHSNDGIWIYKDNSWIREDDLILGSESTESLLNRDTLVISENSRYCNPSYPIIKEEKTDETFEINYSDSLDGSYVFRLTWSGLSFNKGEYLGLKGNSGKWIIYYYDPDDIEELQILFGRNSDYKNITSFSNLVNELSREYDQVSTKSEREVWFYSRDRKNLIEMNTFSTISIDPLEEVNNSLIYQNILTSSKGNIVFWSKTIGRDRSDYDIDESRIYISIEDIKEDGYIIKISRYGYSEYYIGQLFGTLEEEGILSRISKESRLVYCEISDNLQRLPEGKWYLDGAEVETPSAEWYRKSMDMLVGNTLEDSVVPDFFMIPDLSLFGERQDEQVFLPYATAGNFQYLISETTEEEYRLNYLGDKENRLLYFYGGIKYRYQERPAYYVYLRCLLENNHGYQTKDIIYNSGNNPYIDQEELEMYKCNYLVSNNQVYYYNKYQDGENYITSGLLRFIMGKVYREIQKRRWEIIGQKFNALMKKKIEEIAQSVAVFQNVKSIEVINYLPYPELESLEVEVDIWTRELLQNNITLDITINYKKYGN